MSYSEFNRKLEELRVRMARVQRLVAASADPSNQVLSEFFKSLQTTLGEAQILEDKLFAAREEQSLAAREITPSERRRYEEMFDFSPDGCVVTDPSGVILQANHTAADLLNVPHDSLPGNSLILFLPESEHKAYYSRLAQLNESGRVKKWEAQLQPLQGAPFYAAINALSMRNWQGAMTDMVWLIHDITDHKRMEEVLRKERDKAQEYLNIVQTVIVAIDADRKVALINRKGCEVLGYKEEEIVGKNWFDNFLPERIRKDVEAGFQRLMAGKMEEGEYYENPVLTARGERILSWHNAVLCDEAGGIVGTLSSGEDITERKLAEAALRKSEERYRTLVEEAKDMIITVDLKTGIIASANSFAEQILGYSRKEVVGRTHFLSFIHPDEHERAMANLRERVAGDIRTPNFPLRIVKADGECLEAELNGAVIFDDKGNPEIFMCVIRDVTERRHIEQSLRESEQRYRLLVENSLAGIYIRQGDKITFANKRFLDLLGYTQEDLRRMSFIDFVHPEDRETATQRASHRMAGRFQEGPFQYRILKKNGDIVWVEVFGTLFIYGGQRAILGNLIDITERKKFEDELIETRNYLQSLFDNANDIIYTMDMEGRFTFINRRAEEITGYEREETLGQQTLALLSSDDVAGYHERMERLRNGQEVDAEAQYSLKKGKKLVLSFHEVPILKDGKVVGLFGIARDVTEQKKLESDLKKSRAEARLLTKRVINVQEEERRRIARDLHDELGQFVTSVKMDVDALLKFTDVENPRVHGIARSIHGTLAASLATIRRISAALRPNALDDLGLIPAIEYFIEQFEETTSIQCEWNCRPKNLGCSREVATALYRILQEALTNVARYANVDRAKVKLVMEKQRLVLTVEDKGRGFDPAKTHIHERLGIIGMRERAELVGGTFRISSSVGAGVKVEVEVPTGNR